MTYRNEFNLQDDILYLNHAAVSPWPQRTVAAVRHFAEQNGYQGSLDYPQWLVTEQQLREKLACLINAPSPDDIALVKNTSEALSFVAYGVDWRSGDNIVSSNQEFPSNRIVWESLAPQGVELRQADLDSQETPEDALFALVDENTRMIAISSVQYATGLRMDLGRIGGFCRERGILFCVDAIQSIGAVHFDAQAIQADFVAADGHKWMMGPEGLALFYCRTELRERLRLTQFGWHMVEAVGDFDQLQWQPASSARRFECGSPNMLGIHALNASLSLLAETGMDRVEELVLGNSRYLTRGLEELGMRVTTPADPARHAGIVSFNAPDGEIQPLFERLLSAGVFCACRSGNIRFSPHFYTPREKLDQALTLLGR
jgi:selenocysteine lyase/cysteine desulfurase